MYSRRPTLSLGVLNAYRHQSYIQASLTAMYLVLEECSTPNDIKVIFSAKFLEIAVDVVCAQRLTASKLYSDSYSNQSPGRDQVLNAYRHPDFCKFDLRDAETLSFSKWEFPHLFEQSTVFRKSSSSYILSVCTFV